MPDARPLYTHEQALAEALLLGLMAPDEGAAQACALLADALAAEIDDEDVVELAKAHALERWEAERFDAEV